MEGEQPQIVLDVNDFDEKSTVEEVTPPVDPSATDPNDQPNNGTEQPAEETPGEDPADNEGGEEGNEPEETTEEDPQELKRGAEARKQQLSNEIRTLNAQKNELLGDVTRLNAQVYRTESPEELIEQGQDPAMARIEAFEQRQQLTEFNRQVADLNANLNLESLQVMSDFPIFNPEAPEYNETLADRAREVYRLAAQTQIDPRTGLAVHANVLPYQIFKTFAETYEASQQNAKVDAQRSAERMLANSETPSSGSPTPRQAKPDPFLAGLTRGLK